MTSIPGDLPRNCSTVIINDGGRGSSQVKRNERAVDVAYIIFQYIQQMLKLQTVDGFNLNQACKGR